MTIAAGKYKARGIEGSVQIGRTSTGTEQIGIDMELETGDTVTTVLYFSDKAAPYSLERLKALGCTSLDDPAFPGISTNEVEAIVKHEEYQGKMNMKVEILTGGGGRFKFNDAMPETQARSFLARLKQIDKANNVFPPPASSGPVRI